MEDKNIAHYEILEKIGAGGMGVVYLAHDPRLERKVALKVLSEDLTHDPGYRKRFLTEARSASALNHPNVVTIYEIGNDQERDFIAMEYVEGRDLQAVINERGRLPLDELLVIGKQIAAGVAAAHKAGVLHRDLKPGNVILTPEGNVKILDFGLAKRQQEKGPAAGDGQDAGDSPPTVTIAQTKPGMIMGTPGYMSPEKARGQKEDHRSDIFSLGCILYVLASGKTPFVGDSVIDVLHSVLHSEPVAIGTVRADAPVGLQSIISRCLEKEAQDRYSDAAEIESELQDVQLTRQAGAWTPASGQPVVTKSGLRGAPLVMVCTVALLLAAAVVYLLVKPERGVATTTVIVQDEEGQKIQREIPTREFRKRLAILPFKVVSDDTSQSWLAYAASGLLALDIIQDYYISLDLTAELRLSQEAGKVGYPGGRGAPLTLKRQMAKASNCSHFVTGSVGSGKGAAWIEVLLYETDSGRLESKFRHEGSSIFEVADTASLELRRLLGVPEQHLHEWPDLPVTEVSTDSPDALEAFYRAQEVAMISFDLPTARGHLEDAVAADPAFAWAFLSLYSSYITAGEGANPRIDEVIEACMTHIYRLPERMQFAVKSAYFEYKSQPDKQLAVLRMWCDLYPDDNLANEILVQILHVQGRTDEKFAAMHRLLDLEPSNTQYLMQTAGMYEEIGDIEKARGYLETLVEIAPDDPKSHQALGELLQVSGRHQDARDRFEQALLLNPKDLQLQIDLSDAEFQLGNHQKSLSILESTLAGTLSLGERNEASKALSSHLARVGQIDRAIEIMREALQQSEGKISPIEFMASRSWLGRLHVKDGNRDEAVRIADDVRGKFAFPLAAVASIFTVKIYVDLEDFETSREVADELKVTIEQLRWEHVRLIWERTMGRILEGESDLTGALEHYRRFLDLSPTDERSHFYLGRCLRKMAEYESAGDEIALALAQRPSHPEVLFEAALIENSLGNRQQAEAHLDKALEIWKEADAGYGPAVTARGTLRAWSQRN
jgi:tetratricopeptide (TPR) repeat protein/predicted Ser/Thr protein kinase